MKAINKQWNSLYNKDPRIRVLFDILIDNVQYPFKAIGK